MKKQFLYFFIILTFACNKNKNLTDSPVFTIVELTDQFEGEAKYKMQLRLAFGKTVANALESKTFRQYLKKKSEEGAETYFNEILFALHKDDLIDNHTSLFDLLNAKVAPEVRDLFGNDFLIEVLKDDPLVSIKIPDVFFDFHWETEKYSPMVYVKTPAVLLNDMGYRSYQAYHYSGYQEKVDAWNLPKYFCVTVKYSEDFILWDAQNDSNEKGIAITSLFPSITRYKEDVKSALLSEDVLYDLHVDKYFVKKHLIHQKRNELNASSYDNLVINQNPPCEELCPRNCTSMNELNNIFKSIHPKNSLVIQNFNSSRIFKETINFQFVFYNTQNGEIYSGFSTNGFRFNDLYEVSSDVSLSLTKKKFVDICFELPEVDIAFYHYPRQIPLEVNQLILNGWPDNNSLRSIGYSCLLVEYEDAVKEVELNLDLNISITVPSSNALVYQHYNINYCDLPHSLYDVNDMRMKIDF